MALKLYIHWEQTGYPEKTSKIQIPKSWLQKTVKDVIGLFAMPYNNHNKETPIEIDNVHFQTIDGVKIYSNDLIGDVLEDKYDYHIKLGTHVRSIVETTTTIDENLLRCKNYGCNQYYKEDENNEDSCKHHIAPPIFHDTMKCWSCCRDKKAYDFESFQLITGCTIGKHSQIAQKIAIAASPNAPTTSTTTNTDTVAQPQLKSISDFNLKNPNAASSEQTASKIITATRKSTRNADGITAKCQHKGCQKEFTIAENNTTACTYHSGKKKYSFFSLYYLLLYIIYLYTYI